MSDILDMEYINSLPQPLVARMLCGKDFDWPVYDICVQTGLVRIDVCGLLEVKSISDFSAFRDDYGKVYTPDDFYLDGDRAMTAVECES